MATKSGRMFSNEVNDIIAKQHERLALKKAQKLRREEKLAKEIERTEKQIEKLKAK